MITEGGCLCGKVRYAVDAFSGGIFKCHCSKCRRATGGASSAAVLAPEASFRWLQGRDAVREFLSPPDFLRRFCPDCGSVVPQYLPDFKHFWLPAGALDSSAGLSLRHHIHVDSKADWDVLDAATPCKSAGFDS